MIARHSGNSIKQVSFATDVKGALPGKKGPPPGKAPPAKKGGGAGALAKHPSDMSAFERISYVQSLDFEKEEQKEREGVNEDFDDGKLTGDVARKLLAVRMPLRFSRLRYQLHVDPARVPPARPHDEEQTSVLKEEVASASPDLMRVVQSLERGG